MLPLRFLQVWKKPTIFTIWNHWFLDCKIMNLTFAWKLLVQGHLRCSKKARNSIREIPKTWPASQPTLCVAHILACVTGFLADFFLSLFFYPRLNIQCVIMRHLSCKCFKVRQLLCCVLKNECIPSGLRCCLHSAALFAQLRRQRRSLMTLDVWVLMPSLQADTFKTIRTSFRYFQMLEQSVRSWSWESPKPSTFTFNLRHQCIHAFVFAELM